MSRRNSTVVLIGILCALALIPAAVQAAEIQRDFNFPAQQIHVNAAAGIVDLDLPGAMREFRAGRPDLPSVVQVVDVPEGMRVAGVRVVDLRTEPLASGIKLATAARVKPGLGTVERKAPDPAYFGRAGMQPEVPVALGYQGFQRGRHVAYLLVSPVRWD